MYLSRYGLKRRPFSKMPDPEFLFPSRQHAEALARLSFAVEEREIVVVTGEVGAGKTLLARALVDSFAESCRFSFVLNPSLPPTQLLSAIAQGFGIAGSKRKTDVFSALGDYAARVDLEGRFAVVVVDEAQLLGGKRAYDELRLLTNVCADDRALFGLILLGQPELRQRMKDDGGTAFAQRVGVAFHLGPLDEDESGRYVQHRLRVAGRDKPLFTDDGLLALHRLSGGIPRVLNQCAALALLEGFSRDADLLSADVVEAATSDLAQQLGVGARAR